MKTILTFALVAVVTATLIAATISAVSTAAFAKQKDAPNDHGCGSGQKDEGTPEKCGWTIEQDPPDNDGD